MSFEISGKVALVSGGASGIGYAFVKELLKNDAKGVAVVDSNSQNGRKALDELKKEFGPDRCIFIESNVTDNQLYEEAFKKTVDTFKQLDIVINNAGIFDERKWEKVVQVNLNGCINGTLLAIEKYLPQYKKDKEGVIVNVSSVAGLEHTYLVPIYSATKAGVVALSRAYGHEAHHERTGVKTIAVCPGITITPLLGQSERDAVWYLELRAKNPKFALDKVKPQSAEHVAKNLIQVIRVGKSGSTWVVTRAEPAFEETTFPDKDYV